MMRSGRIVGRQGSMYDRFGFFVRRWGIRQKDGGQGSDNSFFLAIKDGWDVARNAPGEREHRTARRTEGGL